MYDRKQAYFTLFVDYQHITLIKDSQMNVWQKKIDDQRSFFRRVFPSKNALRTKRPVFYSPGEFTGRWSEHTSMRENWRFIAVRKNGELSSNLPWKRKNDRRFIQNCWRKGTCANWWSAFETHSESEKKSFSEKNHNTGVWILSFAEKVKKKSIKAASYWLLTPFHFL